MPLLPLTLEVNGQPQTLQLLPSTLLIELIRDRLSLAGTHLGCDTAQCGACTVLMDGRPVKSCNVLALQAQGARVQTVEGLGGDDAQHVLQRAFSRHHALQCGYCTPGLLMRAAALLDDASVPPEPEAVRRALAGNLCRCTGYRGIVDAICEAMRDWRGAAAAEARP